MNLNNKNKSTKKSFDRNNFLSSFSSCLQTAQNRNNNNNNLSRSPKDSVWLFNRIRRSLFHEDVTNRQINSKTYALESLKSEIDQLKSSNSDLWLQIEEILNSEVFRPVSNNPENIKNDSKELDESQNIQYSDLEHIYENLNSNNQLITKLEALMNDQQSMEIKEEVPEKKSGVNKVAEKIEKFNQWAQKNNEITNKPNQISFIGKSQKLPKEVSFKNEKILSSSVEASKSSEVLESVFFKKDNNDYESMLRIKESIERFRKGYIV